MSNFKRKNKVALLIGNKSFEFPGEYELNCFVSLMGWENKVFDIVTLK